MIDLAVGAELDLPTTFYDALGINAPLIMNCIQELSDWKYSSIFVSYCGSTGNPFYEAYNAVPFYAETNYPDVLWMNKTADGKGNVHIKVFY